jgi:hypothetical protein
MARWHAGCTDVAERGLCRMTDVSPLVSPSYGRSTPQSPPTAAPAGWDLSHIGFSDVLSALNPLQYVPVVGTIYREITGDKVNPALLVAVAGIESIFLGPLGLAGAMLGVTAGELWDNRSAAPAGPWTEASDAYHRATRAA